MKQLFLKSAQYGWKQLLEEVKRGFKLKSPTYMQGSGELYLYDRTGFEVRLQASARFWL